MTGWRRLWFQEAGLLVVIFLIGLLLTFASDPVTIDGHQVNNFLRADNLIPNVATTMAPIAIMAVGATIVIAAGGIDISVGSIYGLAALGVAAVLQGMPESAPAWQVLPLAVATALGVGLLCGLINGLIVVGLRMHPFIVTLGTLSIFRGIALVVVPSKSIPTADRTLPHAFTDGFMQWKWLMPRGDRPPLMLQPVPMLIMLGCVLLGWVLLRHMVIGREIYAVGGNEEAARFSGLPVRRIKVRVYLLCGLTAGLAGLVSAGYFGSASTATGEGYELLVVASAVVGGASLAGGRGTAVGALLGALIIKLIENGISILKQINLGLFVLPISKEYTKIIVGIAIVLAVAIDRFSEYLQSRRSRRLAK